MWVPDRVRHLGQVDRHPEELIDELRAAMT